MDHIVHAQLWMAVLCMYVVVVDQAFCYTISTSSWSQLPGSPASFSHSVIINNFLTLIGGRMSDTHTTTNQLFSLTGGRWTEKFPPMPTKRSGTTALCIETALIVAGGKSDKLSGIYELQTVDQVMSTETVQWSTAADLPQPSLWFAPASVCGDHVYILGKSNKLYTCSLQALLKSCKLAIPKEQRC